MSPLKNILQFKNLLLIAAAGLVALFFTVTLFVDRILERSNIEKALSEDANKIASALNETIARSVERITSIGAFYAASQEVERDEFKAFVKPYLSEDSSILAYEWTPRVPGSNRASFEAEAKQAGAQDFKITEKSPGGVLVEAAPRPEYYPVFFIEPMEGNEKAFGYDLASSPQRWEVMHEAMKSGDVLATSALQAVQGRQGEKGFLIFLPIYDNNSHPDTLESRSKNICGFALGIFDIQKLMKNLSQQTGGSDLEISLSEDIHGKQKVVYFSGSHEPVDKVFRYAAPVNVAQRQWILECRSTKAYLSSLGHNKQRRLLWISFFAVTLFLVFLSGAWIFAIKRKLSFIDADGSHPKPQRQQYFFKSSFLWMVAFPIKIMNQLRYGQKFMLISFLFTLPLVLTGVTLISEFKSRIDFSQKEIYGKEYLQSLQKMLNEVSEAYFLANRCLIGEIEARPELINSLSRAEGAIEDLRRVDHQWGGLFITHARFDNLSENLRFLKKSIQTGTPQNFISLSEKFFTEIRGFISHVGDISNLILDPDLDTYYLMDAVLLKFPEFRERLRDLRVLSYQAIRKGILSVDEKAEFIRLHGVISFNVGEVEKGFRNSINNNPAGNLKTSLQKPLADFLYNMSDLLNQSEYNLAYTPVTQIDLASYDTMILKCIDATEALYGQSILDLDHLLERRIRGFVERRNWTLFFSIFVVLIAFYMWLAFYVSFMRIVFSLEKSSESMLSGGEIKETQLETKDELSRVVRSFNNIALSLRKERDQAREGEERFRIVAENTSNLIYEWNMLTDHVNWIGKIDEYLGHATGEFPRTYKAWEMAIHPEDHDRVMEAIDRHIKKREPFFQEYRVVKANGEIATWVDGGTILWDRGKASSLWIGAITDITEKRKLEAQFLQSQKMDAVGKLAGGIAHDLNNLLTVINGYSSLILEPLPPKDPLRADLEEIFKAGKRARDLTDQLLAFSRRQVVRPTSVDLNALLLNVEGMIKRLLGENIEVVTIMSDSLKRVKVDSSQMEQVVMNLAVNARDAMSGKGKIVFETANVILNPKDIENNRELKSGPYVRLSVTDTGLGMTEEVKRRLFEPFFTTKPKGKGTGLGLATCYGIVQQMGGYINVRSEVGKGATMEVFLPVTEEVSSSGEKEKEKEQEVLPKRSETILLVEDESMVRQLCTQVLSKQGYTLFVAQNGVEALNLFQELLDKQTPIDLLLTDVIMPQMGGKEAADKIKKIKPDLKVLFMSGYLGDSLDAVDLLDSGNELIQKPFSPFSLLKTVDQVLGPA